MKLVCTDIATVSVGDIDTEVLKKYGTAQFYDITAPEDTASRICDADIVIVNKTVIGRREIELAKSLKYIGLFATGYNNIDTVAAREHGVVVCNAGQYSTHAVAQHTFALMLELFSKVGFYNEFVSAGKWKSAKIFTGFVGGTDELYGKTLGIFGYGSIGREVAQIARAFGMNVITHTRTVRNDDTVKFVSKDELFCESDVITFHCPLTPETAKALDGDALAKCRDGVCIVNTSRGGVIDEEALAAAIKSGKVRGAALDVLATEPMAKDCPLFGFENVIITPHVAWTPKTTRERLMDIVTSNIDAFLAGDPQNVVN
ncbi:MAG: D-2-hydroxyacid dehydrogenase [Clostridia bacterium]|nr:D-2-hydroxyacid dehydrogenase [Clostridia bacterium]